MTTLNELTGTEKAHWELHLNAAEMDYPSNPENKNIKAWLRGKTELPSIAYPVYIHDWLEYPKLRTEIEALNG